MARYWKRVEATQLTRSNLNDLSAKFGFRTVASGLDLGHVPPKGNYLAREDGVALIGDVIVRDEGRWIAVPAQWFHANYRQPCLCPECQNQERVHDEVF